MTIQQFQLLSQIEKEELLFNDATFLSNHDHGNLLFDIYKLDDFYVRCCYELDKNESAIITAFSTLEELSSFKNGKFPDISAN